MKLSQRKLKQLITEELQHVLNEGPAAELNNIYGAIMNLLMGRGAWKNAGGTEQGRLEAIKIIRPQARRLGKAVLVAQQKERQP